MQSDYIKKREKGKYLSLSKRREIKDYVKLGLTITEISTRISVCIKQFKEKLQEGL